MNWTSIQMWIRLRSSSCLQDAPLSDPLSLIPPYVYPSRYISFTARAVHELEPKLI